MEPNLNNFQFIVIASIHQPSAAVFRMFDKLHLLSKGRTAYYGSMDEVASYFEEIGYPIPPHVHPAEYLLEIAQTDFEHCYREHHSDRPDIEAIITTANFRSAFKLGTVVLEGEKRHSDTGKLPALKERRPGTLRIILTLTHRSLIKSYRDVFAYGIRLAM